jgi:predicted nuclease with RNAse H fold
VRTVGVDLAAEPKRTAVATVDWSAGRAALASGVVGQTDDDVIAAMTGAQRVGLDCPIGWPEPFVEFLLAHRQGERLTATDLAGRRRLAFRETDRVVTALTGLRPLSVSADRIGHAAMRAAGLLARLAAEGQPVDRSGAGLVIESYPAAALRQWGLGYRGYKRGDDASLGVLVDALCGRLGGLDLGDYDGLCRSSHDAFDAVICALIARAAALGLVCRPSEEQVALARVEGWIAVPTCDLADLLTQG